MTRILEAIHELQEGTVLLARTDRKPLFLLEVLLERNLTHRSEMCADGTWLTEIAR